MAVLVVADVHGNALDESTHKTVTAAKAIGGDVDILVAGSGSGDAAAAAAKIDGVRKVLHADGEVRAARVQATDHGELVQVILVTVVGLPDEHDPRSGESRPGGQVLRQGRRSFTPPQVWPDWVLVLDDAARNYPSPGKPLPPPRGLCGGD